MPQPACQVRELERCDGAQEQYENIEHGHNHPPIRISRTIEDNRCRIESPRPRATAHGETEITADRLWKQSLLPQSRHAIGQHEDDDDHGKKHDEIVFYGALAHGRSSFEKAC
jgi:hypothetical protein